MPGRIDLTTASLPQTLATPITGASMPSFGTATSGNFGSVLQSAMSSIEDASANAQQAASKFLAGDAIDIHTVALASQRADLSMELFQQVRNKVVSAYQEIMRSQL